MVWAYFAVLAIFFNVALSQSIRCPPCPNNCGPKLATTIGAPTIVSTTAPTIVDGNVVQSLIDTLQLFIVSDLLADTLPEKNCYVQNIPPTPLVLEYDDCGIEYELVFDNCTDIITDCICNPGCGCEYVTALVPRKCCSDQLILPPRSCELPCGLGYLPGGLPVVAKAFGPCGCGRGCGCGCGCGCGRGCSTGAFPICSPCSCAALAVPLCPNLSPFCKPIIL